MIRRVAIGVTMLFLLSTASVSAATKTIQVFNSAYSPTPVKVKLGTNVNWHNAESSLTHTSTSDLFGLWSEGMSAGTTSDTVAFKQSGSFAYHCTIHSFMHGKVNVRMRATPTTGTLTTTYVIRFATINAPAGFTYDVQKRKHGASLRRVGQHHRSDAELHRAEQGQVGVPQPTAANQRQRRDGIQPDADRDGGLTRHPVSWPLV